MDPKRKKLYIILIVACVIISASVLLWGRSGTPTTSLPATNSGLISLPAGAGTAQKPTSTPTPTKTINPDATYAVPMIFPQSKSFDFAIIRSIQNLQDFQAVTLTPQELGRDNPLKSY
jgi:hypothetical protein